MIGGRQNGVVAIAMVKLIAISIVILAITGGESRELRPSVHGLPFQTFPARAPEMFPFFGEQLSPPAKRPPAPATPGNITDTASDSWWRETPGRKEDRVRKALMVATMICGGTGVVLLLAAAVLFAVHFRRQRLASSSSSAADAVVAPPNK